MSTDEAAVAAPRAELALKRGGVETGDKFPFGSPAILGRFDPSVGPIDIDLGVVEEGSYVSRKHARLECTDGVWSVTDLGSSNGTFVLRDGDFQRVETTELSDGEEVAFGNARLVFRVVGVANDSETEPDAEAPAIEATDPVDDATTDPV